MSDLHAQLCRLVGRAVADYDMIADGDRILVGVSGGTDSMVLMELLERLRQRAPVRFGLFAAIVDEGFGIDHAPLEAYAAARGWRLEVVRTPIAQLVREKGDAARPCGLCSRLRRGFLHRLADRLGCGKIALGHHRDDLCASFLMSLFRGGGLKTMAPSVPADGGSKRVIRPLCYASKELVERVAEPFGFPAVGKCPYADRLSERGDRAYVERLLAELERRFPGIGKNMLRSMGDVRPEHLPRPFPSTRKAG